MFLQRAIRGTVKAVQTARRTWRREGEFLKFKDKLCAARAYSTPQRDFLAFVRRIFEAEKGGIKSLIITKFYNAYFMYGIHIIVTPPASSDLFKTAEERVVHISSSAKPEEISQSKFFRDIEVLC